MPTSWRTKGLLWSAAPGCPGSKLAFGFLSVKNCFPAPGPPRWHEVQLVCGSLKIFRPRSEAAPGGFGLRTKSVSE